MDGLAWAGTGHVPAGRWPPRVLPRLQQAVPQLCLLTQHMFRHTFQNALQHILQHKGRTHEGGKSDGKPLTPSS
jgi:hypothetical protein